MIELQHLYSSKSAVSVARTAAAVGTLAALVGCSSGSSSSTAAHPPAPVLDGTYSVSYDTGAQTVNGKPKPVAAVEPDMFGMRSACTDKGCVATRSAQKEGKFGSPMVLDFVDGSWMGMYRQADATCKDGRTASSYRYISLEPKPDGSLAGETFIFTLGTSCRQVNTIPVTVTRTGDAPEGLDDPTAIPSRVPSAPEGFHGRYSVTVDTAPGTDPPPPSTSEIRTMCVHNSDDCASLEESTDPANPSSSAWQFTSGHWTLGFDVAATCPVAGTPTVQTSVWEMPLPQPVTNPFAKVVGMRTVSNAADCVSTPLNLAFEYTRTGD